MDTETKTVVANWVERKINAKLLKCLVGMNWGDLQTLLLHLFQQRGKATPQQILKHYAGTRFAVISPANPRDMARVDQMIMSLIPGFQMVDLSPVSPSGINVALTALSLNLTLQTVRRVEVTGDPATALSIECARRKREGQREDIRLATSHRSLRTQVFSENSGFTAHFRAFAMASAGKRGRDRDFVLPSLYEHIKTWLVLLERSVELGFDVRNVCVYLSHIAVMENLIAAGKVDREEAARNTQNPNYHPLSSGGIGLPGQVDILDGVRPFYSELELPFKYLRLIESEVVAVLRREFPAVRFCFDLERCAGMGYYSGPCFKVFSTNARHTTFPLADGGVSDWIKVLLRDQKERLFTCGFGTELFCRMFKTSTQDGE